jgi:acid phosphatase family membrane protein YuiD
VERGVVEDNDVRIFSELLHNEPAITAIVAWGVATLVKFLIIVIQARRVDWERLLGTGGMPSTHTTPVVGCATSIGLVLGFNSAIFALAGVLSVVVSYDAAGIRRHAGEQARAINSLISDLFGGEFFKGENPADFFKRWKLGEMKTLLGHNPAEVVVGIALGIVVAVVVHYGFGHLFVSAGV